MTSTSQQNNNPACDLILSLLTQDTPVYFKAGGPSMTPTIRDGETVQVRPVLPADLSSGSILLFRKHNRLILHRLIRQDIRTGELLLTGDAALRGCDRVNPSDIVGLAASVQRDECPVLLDTPRHRLYGRIRHMMRPLRRLIWSRHHTGTSAC